MVELLILLNMRNSRSPNCAWRELMVAETFYYMTSRFLATDRICYFTRNPNPQSWSNVNGLRPSQAGKVSLHSIGWSNKSEASTPWFFFDEFEGGADEDQTPDD